MKDTGLFFHTMAFLNPFPYMYIRKKPRLLPLCLERFMYFICSSSSICCFSQCSTSVVTESHHTAILMPPSLCFTASSSAVASSIAKLNPMILACPAQAIGLLLWSSTSYLLWSDPARALRLFPNRRLQWASSHGMGPAFGHKINPTASRQGLQPVSHLFCWTIRDKGYPEVVFSKAFSKCTLLIYLNPLLLTALEAF